MLAADVAQTVAMSRQLSVRRWQFLFTRHNKATVHRVVS